MENNQKGVNNTNLSKKSPNTRLILAISIIAIFAAIGGYLIYQYVSRQDDEEDVPVHDLTELLDEVDCDQFESDDDAAIEAVNQGKINIRKESGIFIAE